VSDIAVGRGAGYIGAMPRVRGFTEDEAAAIATAIEAGRIQRVRRGYWPNASRPEIVPPERRTPYMKQLLAQRGSDDASS